MPLSKPQRFAVWVTSRLPNVLITDTERVGLSLGFVVTGATSLAALDEPGALSDVIGPLAVINWSVMLILGGVLTIYGMAVSARRVERVGLVFSAIGCSIYGVAALLLGGRASVIGGLFVFLAAVKVIRLLVSTASSAYLVYKFDQVRPRSQDEER